MIRAEFRRQAQTLRAVRISGHAGYAAAGEDVVCASVTSAVQLCANGITEILGVDAEVTVAENEIAITLPKESPASAPQFLRALELHLELLAQDYPKHIAINRFGGGDT